MSKTIESSNGSFYEFHDNGTISKDGKRIGEMNSFGEIFTDDGQQYTYYNNNIIRVSDHKVMGTYNDDSYYTASQNGEESSSYSGPVGSYVNPAVTATIIIVAGVIGVLFNFWTLVFTIIAVFAASFYEAGSITGGIKLIIDELSEKFIYELDGIIPHAEPIIKIIVSTVVFLAAALLLALLLALIIGMYKTLKKSGRPVWHTFVPVLHLYDLFKISGLKGYFTFLSLIPVVGLIPLVYLRVKLAKAFGHSIIFIVASFFFPVTCFLMLGAGKSQYICKTDGSK